MLDKLVKKITSRIAELFTSMAFSVTASACIWDMYQPEVPEALKED